MSRQECSRVQPVIYAALYLQQGTDQELNDSIGEVTNLKLRLLIHCLLHGVRTMAWFSQLKVFHKIMLILVVYAISATTSFFIGANGVNETKDYIIRLEEKIYESVQLATKNSFLLQRADEMFTQAVTAGDPEMVAQGETTVSELLTNVDRLLEIDKDNTQLLRSIQTSAQEYLNVSATLLNNLLSDSPDFDLLQKQGARKAALLDTTNSLLSDHKTSVDELFASAIHGALASSSNTLNIVTVTNIGFFIIMSLLIYYVGKVFSTTVNTMKHSLRELARGDGDLNTRLKVSTQDELGEMTQNFNAFMDKLNSTILQIKNIVPDLASAASSLGKGTADVQSMAGVMRQKSSDAKHSMDEMTRSIQEVSHTANEASTVMQQTRDASAEGLSIVHTSIDNSRELNTQIIEAAGRVERLVKDTEDVSSILDVISAIAEQTNLLALNAAIEAARAGEQGRGFAVVADEVRALASRTAGATTEIRDVLSRLEVAANETVQSMNLAKEHSERNEEQAGQTGDRISGIKTQVESVNSMGLVIAQATDEQSAVVRETHDMITSMNDSMKSIDKAFGDLANMAGSLQSAADKLQTSTSQFRL